MNSNQRSFLASVDIGTSLFVKISGVHTVAVAGVGDEAYGVSHEGTREAPIPGVTPLHAASGESALIYGPGDNCEVLAAEAISAGDFLRPNSAGKAVVAADGENYFAQAVNTVTAEDQKVKITLVRGRKEVSPDSVAAAGSVQGDAGSLVVGFNTVTAADGTKGVVLPAAVAGKRVDVYNSVATNGLKIYPASGGTINGGSADAAITIEGKTLATLIAVDSTNWAATFVANT